MPPSSAGVPLVRIGGLLATDVTATADGGKVAGDHRESYHTEDCDPFVKSRLTSRQSTLVLGVGGVSSDMPSWRMPTRSNRGEHFDKVLGGSMYSTTLYQTMTYIILQ